MSNNPFIHNNIELSNLLISNIDNKLTFDQLLLNGANINAQNDIGWNVLFEVVISHKNTVLIDLVNSGINLNIRDDKGRNALFWAIYSSNFEAVDILISLNIDLYVTDDLHAIHYSVYKNNIILLELLLKYKININEKDELNSTPLIHAVFNNKINVIDFLLQNGADKNCIDALGNSAVSLAKKLKVQEMIEKLKENKCLK